MSHNDGTNNAGADRVRVVEVGPRDGLQNEAEVMPTPEKLAFIARLIDAGCREIEVASFVNPKRVPQMADAEAVLAGLPERGDVRFWALVPNNRGLERAIASGVRAVAFVTAASETFNRINIGRGIAESLNDIAAMTKIAANAHMATRAYISTAVVCPYEGRIAPEKIVPIAASLLDSGIEEISVGDTLGHAEPDDIARLTDTLLPTLPAAQFAWHLHDTRGFALANVDAALARGIRIFDASATGLGGCPFAPGAAGNLATERLVAHLATRGYATGIDPERIAEALSVGSVSR